jgi:Ca-activated chloride channel family protein
MQIVAKDVKVQVSFNPGAVERYRLVGYENRRLTEEEFCNRRTDAGDMGAGHSVTALYEVTMKRSPVGVVATASFRSKGPDYGADAESRQIARALLPSAMASTIDRAPADLRFAAAVGEYAEILRRSKHSTGRRFVEVGRLAESVAGDDSDKRAFLRLVTQAGALSSF